MEGMEDVGIELSMDYGEPDIPTEREWSMDDGRITGTELAGTVPSDQTMVKAATQLFDQISPTSYVLRDDFDNMNDVMVGIFARMYHLMVAKQKDYGPDNISKAGLKGIVTRTNDKVERLKRLVGDSDVQVKDIKTILEKLPDDAHDLEMANALADIQKTVFPTNAVKGESLEDTLLDLADYGLIGYMLYMDAWGKELSDG